MEWRRLVRLAVGAVALFAAIAVAGAAYEAIETMGDESAFPPAGRLVDIGGYSLHLDCRGAGSPAVVMDAGLGGSSLDWTLVQSELARSTRVCAYDRAGMGWSESGPTPRSPGHIAEELRELLESGAITGPYVLVAHSLAGKNARMFAAAHPTEVVGMVLVDARSERIDLQASTADADAFTFALRVQAAVYALARRFGVARLVGGGLVEGRLVAPSLALEMVLLQTRPTAIEATLQEGLARSVDDAFLATTTVGAMPLIVVAAAESIRNIPNWAKAQEALAALSTRGQLVVAESSGHYIQLDEPELIAAAVRRVLSDARNER